MQIDTTPVHAAVTVNPDTLEQRQIASALLLMHSPADDGLTTGWYWTEVPEDPSAEDLLSRQRWTAAITAGQGPFRDANTALAAAANHTPEAAALAARLGQAAELLRAGEIDATAAAIAEWLGETGAARPVGPDPDTTTSPENPEETHRMLAEGEIPEPANDDNADPDTDAPLEVRDAGDE